MYRFKVFLINYEDDKNEKNNDETEQNNTDKEIVGNEELQRDFRQYTNSTKTIENYGGNHLHCKIKIEI